MNWGCRYKKGEFMMMFKEIALNEALRIIGEGNKEKNLYFFSVKKFGDLRCYENYNVVSSDIRNRKWFVRDDGETL